MLVYNYKPARVDISIVAGDTFKKSFRMLKDGVSFPFVAGVQLDMKVKTKEGTTVRTLTSGGGTPELTFADDVWSILSTPFTRLVSYDYDCQLTYNGEIFTIQQGEIIVSKQIT
jgi:hypothetical protein